VQIGTDINNIDLFRTGGGGSSHLKQSWSCVRHILTRS